jgi:hypothetical protein
MELAPRRRKRRRVLLGDRPPGTTDAELFWHRIWRAGQNKTANTYIIEIAL